MLLLLFYVLFDSIYSISGFNIGADAVAVATLYSYFDKHYDRATAYEMLGVGVGIMVMPLLTQLFLDIYGWRGAMLLLGGLNLHIVLCGALFRPTLKEVTKVQREHKPKDTSSISEDLGFTLFKSINFISMISVSLGCGYVGTGWTVYIVPHALDLGYQPYEAALLATTGGIGYLLGSVMFPFLTKTFSSVQILYMANIANCLSMLLDPVAATLHSYAGMMVSSATFGAARTIIFAILYKLINESIDDDKKTIVVMWIFVWDNFGSLASGFLSGK